MTALEKNYLTWLGITLISKDLQQDVKLVCENHLTLAYGYS